MRSGDYIKFLPGRAAQCRHQDTATVLKAARLDWSDIDPSIFGTLFERGLDPDKRSQLGAHYTDRDKIMMLIEPVIIRPLQAEWEEVKAQIAQQMEGFQKGRTPSARSRAYNAAQVLHNRFLERLKQVRVLDPACGSGNFLYLSILALKDLELKVNLDAEVLGLGRQFPSIGPECVKGIEINPYAAELARVTVWIGEIQWMRRNGFDVSRKPILRPLDTIECRDAVMNPDGTEAEWPEAEFVVGNPPFLGDRKMIRGLGEEYTEKLRNLYRDRVPGAADLVIYWFEKARKQIEQYRAERVGLVVANSIRSGANRRVLERIQESGEIYEAWDDEPWVIEGASVRVSLICFAGEEEAEKLPHRLDGATVEVIHADLTAGKADLLDLTQAGLLGKNERASFMGVQKSVPFDIPSELARQWLQLPLNPNGRPNTDVVRPWANAIDIVRRPQDLWIIDFGPYMSEAEAALYEKPFEHVRNHVKPIREIARRDAHRRAWWRFGDARPGMREASAPLRRFIVTPEVSKHRIFFWGSCWNPGSYIPCRRLKPLILKDFFKDSASIEAPV
jgi:type II restriction/modification system DNA methylase subunit YeeA